LTGYTIVCIGLSFPRCTTIGGAVAIAKKDLLDFIAEYFQLDRDYLERDLPLFSSSLLDSTSMITLVSFLEEKTGLTVDANDLTLDNFDTVSAILSFCNAMSE
jgi:acyl carrier protein